MSTTVLVVDDSSTIRQLVGDTLRRNGFEVVEANDGADGLKQLESQSIECVICDINMPLMNGFQMVLKARSTPSLTSVPMIMLTTEGTPQAIQSAKLAGASAWIVKPFNADLLLHAVRSLINMPR